MRNWEPQARGYWREEDEDKESGSALFRALSALDDLALLRAYLSGILPSDLASEPGRELAAVGERHGWDTFRPGLEAVFAATSAASLSRDARLLETLCLAKAKKGLPELRSSLASRFVSSLVAIDGRPAADDWNAPRINRASLLARLGRGLAAAGLGGLLAEAVAHAFSLPKKYPLVEAHLAGLEKLRPWLGKRPEALGPLAPWIDGVESRLVDLTVAMPTPPKDARRPAEVSGKSGEAQELARFLADPVAAEHRVTANQSVRSDLEHMIRRDKLDLKTRTEERGRPYTLVCTKTASSYEAALKKYHEDVRRLAEVRSLRG
ncbi:MAG: hypothetical protein K2W96_11835 [Gemmataceae bacterium]|nr:hypothetical protein [Gemmataceae bacterium]